MEGDWEGGGYSVGSVGAPSGEFLRLWSRCRHRTWAHLGGTSVGTSAGRGAPSRLGLVCGGWRGIGKAVGTQWGQYGLRAASFCVCGAGAGTALGRTWAQKARPPDGRRKRNRERFWAAAAALPPEPLAALFDGGGGGGGSGCACGGGCCGGSCGGLWRAAAACCCCLLLLLLDAPAAACCLLLAACCLLLLGAAWCCLTQKQAKSDFGSDLAALHWGAGT